MNVPSLLHDKVLSPFIHGIGYVYDKTHWFVDKDAWAIYKVFAFGETAGWTMLIAAIIYRKFDLPGFEIAIGIAGRLHGVLFLLYFVGVLITARSMGWGPVRFIAALAAGVPPYTALVYEQLMAYLRKKHPKYIAPPEGYDAG
ncbi:MAG TPA: DUF3817 domain-containing protein [Candidatus Saccharimonadales bacterium]|jgi:integral membrane protein